MERATQAARERTQPTPYTAEELRVGTAAINAPGPGGWNIDALIALWERQNAAIWHNPSGFDRPPVLA